MVKVQPSHGLTFMPVVLHVPARELAARSAQPERDGTTGRERSSDGRASRFSSWWLWWSRASVFPSRGAGAVCAGLRGWPGDRVRPRLVTEGKNGHSGQTG